jgi:hypothetical protein
MEERLRCAFVYGACSNRSTEVLTSNALYHVFTSRRFGRITQLGPSKRVKNPRPNCGLIFPERTEKAPNFETDLLPLLFLYDKFDFSQIFSLKWLNWPLLDKTRELFLRRTEFFFPPNFLARLSGLSCKELAALALS